MTVMFVHHDNVQGFVDPNNGLVMIPFSIKQKDYGTQIRTSLASQGSKFG